MNNDEVEFELYLRQQLEIELKNTVKETEKVLKDKVQKNLYDVYTPVYTRTDDLKDSITSNCSNNLGTVYFDESKLGHTDMYGSNTKLVPQYTNYGHTDNTIDNMFHNYPSRHFVEDAITEMESKNLIFDFKIVND